MDMETNASEHGRSYVAILLEFLAWIICFGVPTLALERVFPNEALTIVTAGGSLFLAAYSAKQGFTWRRRTAEGRAELRSVALFYVLFFPAVSLLIKLPDSTRWQSFVHSLPLAAYVAALIYVPFLLGRAISRRRANSGDS